MKNGDLVIGTPMDTEGGSVPDAVCGRLEIVPVEFMGEKWETTLVFVKDSDGDDTPIECGSDSIQAAGRRAKVTVLS
jgi:hypothetical protein